MLISSQLAAANARNQPTNNMKSSLQLIQDLLDHCRNLDDSTRELSDLRMDCICFIAAGEENTVATLGYDACDTEEGSAFTLSSMQSIMEDQSDAVKAVFVSQGFKY
tara:strand:- start:628 stop:948 length:321 start_codon:yes stop_codon:yes gene_type:complete